MNVGMEHWSASRFLCWEQCPAEFYARYIAKHPEEPTEAMLFGSAIHQALETHYKGGDRELTFRAAWKTYVTNALHGDVNPNLTAIGLDLLDETVALGLEGESEWGFQLATEETWGAPTVGFVDLVSTDRQRVFDFKTTTGAWSAARAAREIWQPTLYSWAVADGFQQWPWPTFTYVVLNKVTRHVELFEAPLPEERWPAMDEAARAIALRVASDDFACHGKHGSCPECGSTWQHGHVCDLTGAPPRIRLKGACDGDAARA